ncbi:hypothetical protein E2C01_028302 [Portunus trituberculatus]|uniref:Uncharacterized protein n=1 Tax=Portunus trituberculatus TaxID=210409 RepID=A0A5B7ENY3_PORTR|nr:hypothetical protein [Portunus trituberculatus]
MYVSTHVTKHIAAYLSLSVLIRYGVVEMMAACTSDKTNTITTMFYLPTTITATIATPIAITPTIPPPPSQLN